jgi:hypothetical protein
MIEDKQLQDQYYSADDAGQQQQDLPSKDNQADDADGDEKPVTLSLSGRQVKDLASLAKEGKYAELGKYFVDNIMGA